MVCVRVPFVIVRSACRSASATNSVAAALKCSVDSLDLSAEDEVIIPSFTIISCVTAVLESGATPILSLIHI